MSYKYNEISEELNCGGYDFSICDDYHYIKIGATNVSQLKKLVYFLQKIIMAILKINLMDLY